jgi:molybdopterin synthase catalytic subunit
LPDRSFRVSVWSVKVTVKLFASLHELVGRPHLDLELADGATLECAFAELALLHPALAERRRSLAAAVNRRYAPFATALTDGDEVAFIPPVSGG